MKDYEYEKEWQQDAYKLFLKMERQIEKIIQSIKKFNRAYEEEDYRQEAVAACFLACKEYDNHRNAYLYEMPCSTIDADIRRFLKRSSSTSTDMKKETLAFWYVQKALYKMADTGEVLWTVFSPSGKYFKTLKDKEYRQQRKKLKKMGCTFQSYSAIIELKKNNNEIKDVDDFENTKKFSVVIK